MAKKDDRLFIRLDIDYADHPKVVRLSDAAFRAHIELMLYARKYLTDGFIPKRVANRVGFESVSELLTNDPERPSLIELEGGDYMLHGFTDMNQSREEVEEAKRRNSRNGARGGRPKKRKETQSVSESVSQSQTDSGTQKKAEIEIEIEKEVIPPISPPEGDAASSKPPRKKQPAEEYTSEFEAFWAIYPKKVDKRVAFKAWKNALDRASAEQITEGCSRYRGDPNRDDTYTKNASTWLNADAWDNDPLPPRISAGDQRKTFDQMRHDNTRNLLAKYFPDASEGGSTAWPSQLTS